MLGQEIPGKGKARSHETTLYLAAGSTPALLYWLVPLNRRWEMARKRKAVKRKFDRKSKVPLTAKRGEPIALECATGCGRVVDRLPADTRSVTCSYCTAKMVSPPEGYGVVKPDRKGWPRGWHKRKRFDGPDGKTYIRGIGL